MDGDAYALGTAIISLTQKVRINIEFRDRAAPLVRALADKCRESVYLAVPENDQVLYIYALESSHRLLARSAVGDHALMHCTSVGKAILFTLPDDVIAAITGRTGLPEFTKNTLTSYDTLIADLEKCRERGYSVDNQEHERNTYCLGSPILDAQGRTIGACSISGGDPEILGSRAYGLSQDLIQTTQQISRLMGYMPSKSNDFLRNSML